MAGLLGIYDVEAQTGISAYTIRYYDKCGFFPNLLRDASKSRCFRQSDVDQLLLIDALRTSGMSIADIKEFVQMQSDSDTNEEVAEILETQLAAIEARRAILDISYERIERALQNVPDEEPVVQGKHSAKHMS